MKIQLERINQAFHFRAKNEEGQTLDMDASPDIGGENKGMRPMQLLLAAAGGCSVIDVISILKKQKEPVEDVSITIDGEREKDAIPSLFQTIHLHFTIYGKVNPSKVQRALDLSIGKYCSVSKMLEKTAKISYDFSIAN